MLHTDTTDGRGSSDDSSPDSAAQDAAGMGATDDIRRLRLVFRGEVQGVGFRWTSSRCANSVGCTGWVRNEPDWQTVTMELQGTQEQISAFFGAFAHAYARYPIEYVIDEKDDIPPVEGEPDFRVRY
ncbi:acylphosphatase [Parafannyhessea umbonata]|jgi:acylphosphatase|uniref:acylphosphatase n=1 Tax=Parafannyhessea umbonata TaxID=604330 RepID=UPI003AB46733